MPFIAPKRRDEIHKDGPSACQDVGDPCFIFYSQIMSIWRTEPRWRTAHRIYRQFFLEPVSTAFFQLVYEQIQDKFELMDVIAASHLAYQVFFQTFVMPYEVEKENQNGTI